MVQGLPSVLGSPALSPQFCIKSRPRQTNRIPVPGKQKQKDHKFNVILGFRRIRMEGGLCFESSYLRMHQQQPQRMLLLEGATGAQGKQSDGSDVHGLGRGGGSKLQIIPQEKPPCCERMGRLGVQQQTGFKLPTDLYL